MNLSTKPIEGLRLVDIIDSNDNLLIINRLKFKKLHHKGKDLKRPQVWVFGMYQRGKQPKCLFVVVPKRDAFTLLNVIYDKILPNTKQMKILLQIII